jgi:hypothetical protein
MSSWSGIPGVEHTVEFTGFSGLDGTNRSNTVTIFLVLTDFEKRVTDPAERRHPVRKCNGALPPSRRAGL